MANSESEINAKCSSSSSSSSSSSLFYFRYFFLSTLKWRDKVKNWRCIFDIYLSLVLFIYYLFLTWNVLSKLVYGKVLLMTNRPIVMWHVVGSWVNFRPISEIPVGLHLLSQFIYKRLYLEFFLFCTILIQILLLR